MDTKSSERIALNILSDPFVEEQEWLEACAVLNNKKANQFTKIVSLTKDKVFSDVWCGITASTYLTACISSFPVDCQNYLFAVHSYICVLVVATCYLALPSRRRPSTFCLWFASSTWFSIACLVLWAQIFPPHRL